MAIKFEGTMKASVLGGNATNFYMKNLEVLIEENTQGTFLGRASTNNSRIELTAAKTFRVIIGGVTTASISLASVPYGTWVTLNVERGEDNMVNISAYGLSDSVFNDGLMPINDFGALAGVADLVATLKGQCEIRVNANGYTFDLDEEDPAVTVLQDVSGNGNDATLVGQNATQTYIANPSTGAEATTSTLNIDMSDSLPASGALTTRVLNTAGNAILYAGTPTYTDGAFSIDLPIATVPVGTLVDWVAYDIAGEEVAGARQATETTEV